MGCRQVLGKEIAGCLGTSGSVKASHPRNQPPSAERGEDLGGRDNTNDLRSIWRSVKQCGEVRGEARSVMCWGAGPTPSSDNCELSLLLNPHARL